jgi:hypothetical protein
MADVTFSIQKSYSVALDGDGDYLFTTPIPFTYRGIFTIELWFKTNAIGTSQGLFFSGNTASDDQRFQLELTNVGGLHLYIEETNVTQLFASNPGIITPNRWYHVAVVASYQAPTYLYLDGNLVNVPANMTVTLSNTFANNIYIGLCRSGSLVRYLNGYISDFRVVNGSAVYNGNFFPPTEPLYPIQNTTLLTCQSSILIDNSYNPSVITPFGNARVDRNNNENPFGFSTSTPVSANLFNDILTTDSIIDRLNPTTKSAFDIYDIQSGIDILQGVASTDESTNKIPTTKSAFDIYDIQTGIDITQDVATTNELTTQISPTKLEVNISETLSSIDITQDITSTDELVIPKILRSQSVLQYNINSRNNFSNDNPIPSTEESVRLLQDFLSRQINDPTSAQKINSVRVLEENTQTVLVYSYWI